MKRPFSFCLIFLSTIFILGCPKLHAAGNPASEQLRIEKLLKYIMIRNYGLYTLVGSKPMTIFSLTPLVDKTERKAAYEALPEDIKKKTPVNAYMLMRHEKNAYCREWLKEINRLFCDQYTFHFGWGGGTGIFINVPEVLFIFDKFSKDFAEITGMQKSPSDALEEIGDDSSEYWLAIKHNHYLLGLLLGFGEKNSKFFQWERDKKALFPLRRGTGNHSLARKPLAKLSMEHLGLPAYVIYQPIDHRLEHFKTEREKCKALYDGKDFTEFTLQILTGSIANLKIPGPPRPEETITKR